MLDLPLPRLITGGFICWVAWLGMKETQVHWLLPSILLVCSLSSLHLELQQCREKCWHARDISRHSRQNIPAHKLHLLALLVAGRNCAMDPLLGSLRWHEINNSTSESPFCLDVFFLSGKGFKAMPPDQSWDPHTSFLLVMPIQPKNSLSFPT